jgi:hypothetical protein
MIQNDAHDYTINRIGGTGKGSKNGQGLYQESSTPKFAIGAKLELGDNRVFRYSYASAAITVGKVVSTDSAQTIVADANGVFVAAAAGSTEISVTDATLSSVALNHYAGGYFGNITNGEQYRIKSNTAASSNLVKFTFYDGIATAVVASDDYMLYGGPYNGVITATVGTGDTAYDRVVGVNPIAVTSGYYFWLQTAGIAFALNDATAVVLGDNLQLSDSVAGAVQTQDAGFDTPVIGQAMGAAAAAKHCPFMLNIGG